MMRGTKTVVFRSVGMLCLDCHDFVTKEMPMTFQSKMAHLYKTHRKTVKRFIIKNELDSSKHLKKSEKFLAG